MRYAEWSSAMMVEALSCEQATAPCVLLDRNQSGDDDELVARAQSELRRFPSIATDEMLKSNAMPTSSAPLYLRDLEPSEGPAFPPPVSAY